MTLFTSDQEIKASFLDKDGNIELNVKTQPSGTSMKSHLFIYGDMFQKDLLLIAEITLRFHDCFRLSLQVGSEQLFNLSYRPLTSTTAEVYSRDPKIV